MKFVEPIQEEKKIEAVKKNLLGGNHYNYRDYLLFTMGGINTGLRVSDLLKLKYTDVLDDKGKFKSHITIKEKKTGETSLNGYIFVSRKGENKPITRQRAWQVINEAAQAVGIQDEIGTHTLRKTFGYHARMKGVSIELIQKLFNHSAPSITMKYIGITQDELDNDYFNLNL